MTALPVNAIYSGMQMDGHWAGTPSLIIQLMEHPLANQLEHLDGSYPVADWDLDYANEISINKLLARRSGASSPHFSHVGPTTLSEIARSYRERHVLIIGREPGRHDVAPVARALLGAGRSVQILTTAMTPTLVIPDIWITLMALPSRTATTEDVEPENATRPDEILACVRWRSDIDRAEALYARRTAIWLRPSPLADESIRRQCVAVASRHPGWRVMRPGSL